MNALIRIAVGVVVERRKAASEWVDYIWLPIAVLPDTPETAPWTVLAHEGDRTTFYAGPAMVELHPAETSNYRANLQAGPHLWVVLRPTDSEPAHEVVCVTADPSEGEGFTEAGNDIVESVPMPESIRAVVETFVAEHHVEQQFFKRKRDRADKDALARRGRVDEDER